MKWAFKVNWILTIGLSIATGGFKLAQQPADIELFQAIGLNTLAVTLLGGIQLIGGGLLIPARTRIWGAYLLLPTYILASIAVFANQMMVFGGVSILFIVMVGWIIVREKSIKTK